MRSKDLLRNIRDFIQRGKRGWSETDSWSIDYYLSRVISESVARLRERDIGYPSNLEPDEWQEILCAISDGFRLHLKVYDDIKEVTPAEKKKIHTAKRLFVKYFEGLWD